MSNNFWYVYYNIILLYIYNNYCEFFSSVPIIKRFIYNNIRRIEYNINILVYQCNNNNYWEDAMVKKKTNKKSKQKIYIYIYLL